ncbi:MAG: hypothetical protein LBS19_16940 [Clostridiales bacterium]|jgi:N-acetylglucosamine kinase-like BadF-type ATPase|nr:hypothetical protein [Clostridiales bacterium]
MLYLGIDGGGTKSAYTLIDGEGRVVKEGISEGLNTHAIGAERAAENLALGLERLLGAVPAVNDLSAICLACAGLGRATDKATWAGIFSHLDITCPALFASDIEAALMGGLHKRTGIAVLSGTGSIAAGYDESGAFARAGGFGHIIGDEGSAYDIGRRILNAVVRAYDGLARPTVLTGQVLSKLGLADVPDLVPVIYGYKDKKDIAAFAELLGPALAAGDEAAAEIAEAAAQSLAELGAAAARKLGFAGGFDMTTGGGILTNNAYIYKRFAEMIAEALPEARLVKPKSPPSYGAALMALLEPR